MAQTLVKLYVSDPTNADQWLADEIYRAACDPGAIGVFQYVSTPSPYTHHSCGESSCNCKLQENFAHKAGVEFLVLGPRYG